MFDELKTLQVFNENTQGYIYVLMNNNNYIKIGRTTNPYQRFNSLSGSNTGGSQLVKYYLSKPMYIDKTIEKVMHQKFSDVRQTGEWFYSPTLHFEDVVFYLDVLCNSHEFKKCNETRKSFKEKTE